MSRPHSPQPLDEVRAGLMRELLAWMGEGIPAPAAAPDERRFDELALRVFAYQFAANEAYRRFCERRGVRPEAVQRWQDIPAVATDAFKEVPLTCFPPQQAEAVFVTSGTTRQAQRGRHYLRTLKLYEASLLPAFEAYLLPDGARLPAVILGFSPRAMPQSSLSHMFGVVQTLTPARSAPDPSPARRERGTWGATRESTSTRKHQSPRAPSGPGLSPSPAYRGSGPDPSPSPVGTGPSAGIEGAPQTSNGQAEGKGEGSRGDGHTYFLGPDGVDIDGAASRLAELEAAGQPVLVMGTAFAFVHLLDELHACGRRLRLAPGSRLMDTGGYKGRSREVPKDELYGLYTERLGIAPDHIVNEYGMTEMGSQFYDGVLRGQWPRRKQGPPWVRTIVADPETLAPAPAGQSGVLRHYDLANLDSVMALQTADLGVADAQGFEITGRAAGAEARGCSLAVEELLSAQR